MHGGEYTLWSSLLQDCKTQSFTRMQNEKQDYTGRFIMFSVITNIYNKKNQRTYLNRIVHSHRKTEKVFCCCWQLEMFGVCTTGDTTHIDTLFKFLPHMRQHGCFMLAQIPRFIKLFIPRTNGLDCGRVLCVLCKKCTLHSNHRLTRVIVQHTKQLLPRRGHFLTTYTRIA